MDRDSSSERKSEADSEEWTILRVLDWTRQWFERKGIETPRLDAEILIAHCLKLERVMLYAHFDRPLDPEELAQIRGLVARRGSREPIAHILGHKEFFSLALAVTRDVLIPRPDTETLVDRVLANVDDGADLRIADVGTGSGCIAIALAKSLPSARLVASDISEAALGIAKDNVATHALLDRIELVRSDLLRDVSKTPAFDVVVANLPYLRTDELQTLEPDVKDYEPHLALVGGGDGLDLIRRLISEVTAHLKPRGLIALEASGDQLVLLADLLTSRSFVDVAITPDLGGIDRVVTAKAPA